MGLSSMFIAMVILEIVYCVVSFVFFMVIMLLLGVKGAKEKILWAFALLVIIGFIVMLI